MQKTQAIIIDNGSQKCKIGMSSQQWPIACFYNVVGRPFLKNRLIGTFDKQYSVGDEAMQRVSYLNLKSPFDRSNINNWEDITHVLFHGFYNQARRQCSQYPCLMTQSLQTTRQHRQKITQLMFEHFNVPQFYLQKAPRLAMYSFGEQTGVVVDCGHSLTQICPFINDQYFPNASQINQLGGLDLNRYLNKLLKQVAVKLSLQQLDKFKNIKSTHCYVALDYQAQLLKPKESLYQLPDGRKVSLTDQRFRCPEILFTPNMIGRKVPGIHESIFNAIRSCDKLVADKLYERIYLTGGSTMFPGFTERLTKQLNTLVNSKISLNIITDKQPLYSNWVGGRILASMSSFEQKYITKKQYEQSGSTIIHKKYRQ